MNKKALFFLGGIGILFLLANSGTKSLLNNLVPGKPKVRSLSLTSGNNIFQVNNFGDFFAAIKDVFKNVFQNINILQILQGNFQDIVPQVGFLFDLDLPVENKNNIPLPNNSFNGTLSLDGNPIGNVSYPNTDIPANSTVTFSTRVNASLGNAVQLAKKLFDSPNTILKGFDIAGTFNSNGASVPFVFNAKLFE